MKHNTSHIIHYTFMLSLIVNLLLIGALIYIGVYKTDYFERVHARMTHTPYVPERSDNCCVDSWNNCIEKLNMQADVVFFGDSHIAGGDYQNAFPNVKSINLGYIGEDTKGMLRRVDAISAVQPKKVFLMGGINGLRNQSLDDFEFWYAALVDSIHAAVPEAKLYIHSLLPVTSWSDYCDNAKIVEANTIIAKIAAERGIEYIDIHSRYAVNNALPDSLSYDGLHLIPSAYAGWYEIMNERIKE